MKGAVESELPVSPAVYLDMATGTVPTIEIGVFLTSNHNFYLDFNANGIWDGASVDKRYDFSTSGDITVSRKW